MLTIFIITLVPSSEFSDFALNYYRPIQSAIRTAYRMSTSLSQAEPKEEPDTSRLRTTTTDNIESDIVPEEDEAEGVDDDEDEDFVDPYEGMDDEAAMKKWLSTGYERGSQKPMKLPLTAPWDIPISDADVAKLKVGFKSQSMEDRWELLVENPDEDGGMSIHIFRSWLMEECYVLHIIVLKEETVSGNDDSNSGGSRSRSASGAKIHRITWEGNKAGLQCDAAQARKEAVMVARWILNCEFEALPHYSSKEFWQSSGYKKLEAT